MALGSTQPLTETSTRNLPGGKGRPARKADKPYRHLWADCLEKMWERRRLKILWTFTACYRDSFTFTVRTVNYTVIEIVLLQFDIILSIIPGKKFC
jgi:hypothetical protein